MGLDNDHPEITKKTEVAGLSLFFLAKSMGREDSHLPLEDGGRVISDLC